MGWNAEMEGTAEVAARCCDAVRAGRSGRLRGLRSFAVRALVLWILRPAADFTLNFVIREAQLSGAPMPVLPTSIPFAGNDPADAHHPLPVSASWPWRWRSAWCE
jgi:hypothetical protein